MAPSFCFLKAVQPFTARSSVIGGKRFLERLGSKLGAAATPSAICTVTKGPGYADEGRLVSHINGFCWLRGKTLPRKFQPYELSADEERLVSRMGSFRWLSGNKAAEHPRYNLLAKDEAPEAQAGLPRKFQPAAEDERLVSRMGSFRWLSGNKAAEHPRYTIPEKDEAPEAPAACARCYSTLKSAQQIPRYMRGTASSIAKRVVQ